jgi:glucosylceramidase
MTSSDKLKFGEYEHTSERQPIVFINEKVTFQTIEGFGGAITDAAAETYFKLPEDKRNEIIRAYFGSAEGIGYNLVLQYCRLRFSSSSYSYVNDGDTYGIVFHRPLLKAKIRY